MQITPINHTNNTTAHSVGHPNFRHEASFWQSDYSAKDKLIVAGTTAAGVTASLLALAKFQGHSVKPKNFLDFLKTTEIKCKEVISMGIGTCLGGLAGGYIIDKDPDNRKAKRREAVMQIGNISIPIITVAATDALCNKFGVNKATTKGKVISSLACLGGVFAGIYIANFAMNKLSNLIFKDKSEERGIKTTDLFPHVDDLLASAQYVAPNSKFVLGISRIVPIALMVPGNEIGNKKAHHHTRRA